VRERRLGASNRRQHLGKGIIPAKSLMMLPERYRIAAVDELGLIARAVIVWSKPNGLPESVTDRVRRSHEDWVHLTKSPRYFAAVDEIREPYAPAPKGKHDVGSTNAHKAMQVVAAGDEREQRNDQLDVRPPPNPLGKLPGSVWSIPTQPLRVPAELGVDHFAAFPMEWPRRIIQGWCPAEVCTACGEGRRPVTDKQHGGDQSPRAPVVVPSDLSKRHLTDARGRPSVEVTVTGYACACPDTTAPATPGVVLDPFGGTGTTVIVACALGRRGISIDLNPDYKRLAEWRAADPKQRAKASAPA
jgi:hypothetical protein